MIRERRESGFDARTNDIGKEDLLGSLVHANADSSAAAEVDEADEIDKVDLDGKKAVLTDDEGRLYFIAENFIC